MNQTKESIIRMFFNYIKIIFFEGLLVILPITLTLALFKFFFRLLKYWLTPIYLLEPTYLQKIPQSEIFLVLILILLTGAIFRHFFLHSFLHFAESIFFKIPLLNPIYSGIKQLVQAFTKPEKLGFKKVVLVEFPRAGSYSIGFLTQELPSNVIPTPSKNYHSIFVPHTPNPTTGFFLLVAEDQFLITDLTRQEAMALVISGGIVQPDRLFRKINKEDYFKNR